MFDNIPLAKASHIAYLNISGVGKFIMPLILRSHLAKGVQVKPVKWKGWEL